LVLITGALLGLFVLVAAVVAEDADEGFEFESSGTLIAEAVGAGAGLGTPGLNAPQLPPGMAGEARMQTVAIPGLVPFSAAQTERFGGRVVDVSALGTDIGWGQVHVTVADDTRGVTRLVSLAPTWYLQYLGCPVGRNDRVAGIAFRFDSATAMDVPLYARTVTINGRSCQLRSDEGFALWSNRLGQRQ